MNQLQSFIYFLKRMDIVMLNDILTDDISYCGTTKKLFLEKLQDIFDWNVFLGIKLLPVEWSETNSNCLRFFCWRPNEYENTLLVTSKEDGGIISFINKTNTLSFHNSYFRVYEDEEIGFVKSANFIILQNQCKKAIDEMIDVVFTTDLILNWVEKHESLYKEIIDEDDELKYINIKNMEEFYELWNSKLIKKESILNYKKAEIAVQEYNQLQIRDWLIKYEHSYYYDFLHPNCSLAVFLCDKEYRFKEGKQEYKSKELYLIEKFFDLYSNASI